MERQSSKNEDSYNEATLIDASKAGDVNAFSKIVNLYTNKVYTFCYRITQDKTEADDLFQEVFFHAYRKLRLFSKKSSFSTWLYRIAINLWVSKKRKSKKIRVVSLNAMETTEEGKPVEVQLTDPEVSPEVEVERKEVYEIVIRELSKIDSLQRLAIVLRYIEDKPYVEIAKICRCTVGTVASRIYRGLEVLRRNLLSLLK